MELISTHICKGKNVGVHGNLFGGTMLAWLDEAAAAFAAQSCDTPRVVTVKLSEVHFKKPVRVGHIIKIYADVKSIGDTSMTIRIDGDGEPIPLSEKVKNKFKDGTK